MNFLLCHSQFLFCRNKTGWREEGRWKGRKPAWGTPAILDTLDRARERKEQRGWRERSSKRRETRERTMRTPEGSRIHEGSPRAILWYKSKATSFRCNTRGSIGASWRALRTNAIARCWGTKESRNVPHVRHATVGYLRLRSYETRKTRWSRTRWPWPSISWRYCGCRRRWPRPWHCRPARRSAEVRTTWWRAYMPTAWRRSPSTASSTKYLPLSTRCWPIRRISRCPRASPS